MCVEGGQQRAKALLDHGARGLADADDGNIALNASIVEYTEITPQNIGSFHFHGDPDGFPVDAILAVPTDRKSGILLRGRYEQEGTDVQMLVPSDVVREILETMFSVRDYVILGSIGVGVATLITAGPTRLAWARGLRCGRLRAV